MDTSIAPPDVVSLSRAWVASREAKRRDENPTATAIMNATQEPGAEDPQATVPPVSDFELNIVVAHTAQ